VFEMTDAMGWANATDLVAEMLTDGMILPFRHNVPADRDIVKTAHKFEAICNVAVLPLAGAVAFSDFRSKDASVYGSITSEAVISAMASGFLWPVSANAVETGVVDDVLVAFEMFSNVSDLARISRGLFEEVDPRDPTFYGNSQNVSEARTDLWDTLSLPVLPNDVTEPQMEGITNSPEIYDVQPFVTQVRNPLEYFELDDTHLYTGDIVIAQVIEDVLVEFDPELPLVPNALPAGIADAAIADLDVCSIPITPLGLGALAGVHPYHRKVVLDRETYECIVDNGIDRLPLCANSSTPALLDEILACCDTKEDPMFCQLPLEDALPLVVLEAPDEVDADVDELVACLMGMILQMDVVPFVPAMDDVHDEEFTSVIGDLISIPGLDEALSDATAALGVHRITNLGGPLADMPVLVTPDEVVWNMLWQFLLPEMPVRPREIEEFIADELDELDIQPSELGDEEESLREEVEKLLTYRPKRTMQ
jgi:hypothetical protein